MFKRFPVLATIIVAVLICLLIWGGWTLAYNQGWVAQAPSWDVLTGSAPSERSMLVPTPTAEPTVLEQKAAPTAPPADDHAAPPAEPTKAPEAVYTLTGKTVSFTMKDADSKENKVTLETFTYKGGWQRGSDSWFIAKDGNLEKETPESFGTPISGDDWAKKTSNWLKRAVSDPWTLTWFRFQMHRESFSDMEKVNQYAKNLADLPTNEYDEIANATLSHFFKRVNNGRAEVDPNWGLEVMLREPGEGKGTLELFARTNSDGNHTPDLLVTFYAKGESTSFISYKKAWSVAAKAAGVSSNKFKPRAYVNLTEGGTWKWKVAGGGSGGNPPTDAPTSTPKPDKDRPTKDPKQRPTPPVGGGEVNPKNSEDPHTTNHTESTPAPKVTEAPKPTATPTPVPTAVVRPTENCETVVPNPVREDKNTPPPSNGEHNVPTEKPGGVADDSFDPDSI